MRPEPKLTNRLIEKYFWLDEYIFLQFNHQTHKLEHIENKHTLVQFQKTLRILNRPW